MVEFEFVPPGETQTFLAVAHPLYLEQGGAIRSARSSSRLLETELRDRLVTLLERLALALLAGVLVTTGLAWYLSGRITRPVRRLAKAADEVAEGNYDVELPEVQGRDEIADLADSFRQMASRLGEAEELERNFLMTVSHELRTPLTAIRGHVEALREGLVRGSGSASGLARRDRSGGRQARAARRRRPRPREARHAPVHGAARGGGHGDGCSIRPTPRSARRRSNATSSTRRRSRPRR